MERGGEGGIGLVCFVDICEFDNARLIGSIEPTTITYCPTGPIYLSG